MRRETEGRDWWYALTVRPFGEDDRAAWASFVHDCPDATFFHRIEWRDIIEQVFGHRTHYLLARRGVEIVGVLPLAQVKSLLFGHSLVSLPFAVYGGAAVTDEEARVLLHTAAAELARQLQVDYLELRNRSSYEPGWPQQDLFVTFRRSIAPDAEANMLAIPRKQRDGAEGHAAESCERDRRRRRPIFRPGVLTRIGNETLRC